MVIIAGPSCPVVKRYVRRGGSYVLWRMSETFRIHSTMFRSTKESCRLCEAVWFRNGAVLSCKIEVKEESEE